MDGGCKSFALDEVAERVDVDFGLCDSDFHAPNGVVLSPDEKVLYVSDVWNGSWQSNGETNRGDAKAHKRLVYAYEVKHVHDAATSKHDLSFGNRTVFIDFAEEPDGVGYPDGLKCDISGNLYVGCGDGVRVFQPDGAYLGKIDIPGGCANLCFGGEDGRTLIALCETRVVQIPMAIRGDARLLNFHS